MKILLVCPSQIPISTYEDAERVAWWLGKELAARGHEVTFLAKKGSECPFAAMVHWDDKKALDAHIPPGTDLVHFHSSPKAIPPVPYLISCYENSTTPCSFDHNTVFLSAKHAQLHGGEVYVPPGMDFDEYGHPNLTGKRPYFHFLGNAAWSGKNVRGAIDLATRVDGRLHVIGGTRVNFRKGLRITLSPSVRFHGVLSGPGRNALLGTSQGFIFPVIWHEPSSLAVAESLYFGCPVFGTPYGALPEALGQRINTRKAQAGNGTLEAFFSDFGCLSVKKSELVEALKNANSYDRAKCHEWAVAHFSASRMTNDYLRLYEKVLAGRPLHTKPPVLAEVPDDKPLPIRE